MQGLSSSSVSFIFFFFLFPSNAAPTIILSLFQSAVAALHFIKMTQMVIGIFNQGKACQMHSRAQAVIGSSYFVHTCLTCAHLCVFVFEMLAWMYVQVSGGDKSTHILYWCRSADTCVKRGKRFNSFTEVKVIMYRPWNLPKVYLFKERLATQNLLWRHQ